MSETDIEKVSFTLDGWDEYTAWQREDKRTLKKINALIQDIARHPYEGIGHPEPLKGNLSGYWSRAIDAKNRLTYKVLDHGKVIIAHCNGHYRDR